ncbi:aminodeoxychorismate synthase component I [Corynebacterium poyangense]|uniref:aminodeoxychorismate synthase n=1 Tax=Corynebacterium poyangense TaxID=2684405 RepID=A0A7H0SQZ0_9CORY|nr:chorismate-binding protein [Corynebacterium poyangense]MBZ8176383.1 aminodeoxychorismate synthase component I [Corynebacterium poyangense]QNQ90965.1 aminodeoxychorismate synthase component I [Corynebacterium poyangense]
MPRVLIIDNHDSFTFNIVEELRHLGVEPLVIPHDHGDTLPLHDVAAIIISPGPGRAYRPDDVRLSRAALATGLPVLGICLGMQLIAHHCGAHLVTHPPHHGMVSAINHTADPLFSHLPNPFHAVRYHSWIISHLPEELIALAHSEDGVIQAIKHRDHPWWGVQFHPESISTQQGRELLSNFLHLAGWRRTYRQSIPNPWGWTAPQIFSELCQHHPQAVWLDDQSGGWSVLALFHDAPPIHCRVHDATAHSIAHHLRPELTQHHLLKESLPFSFRPGWVGWIGYHPTDGAEFLFVSTAIVVGPGPHPEIYVVGLKDETATAATFATVLSFPPPASVPLDANPIHLTARDSRESYLDKIARLRAEIAAGESYEACLTTQFHGVAELNIGHYMKLREANPVPYGGYFRCGDTQLLSVSPELFLRLDNAGQLCSAPIKGTRPASADPRELANNPKDRAENRMITDLVRHDLAHVAEPGTVTVEDLFKVESYATVHQLLSVICAQIRPDLDIFDALAAAFPGGSMTGAPKERSCHILERIEEHPRGIYSGCFGWFGCDGSAELAMTIRTVVAQGTQVSYGTGGAILYASDPHQEWEEILSKTRALQPIAHLEQ